MARVLLRNIDDDLMVKIKQMAQAHDHSMQKELKQLLNAAVNAFDSRGTIYPPVEAVRVKGSPASALLVQDRR